MSAFVASPTGGTPTLTGTSSAVTGQTYTQKQIDVTITLGEGTFGGTGSNTVTLSNLRVVASIAKAGFPSFDRAEIRVYGIPPSIMNQVSTLGINPLQQRLQNTVTISAGDSSGKAVVYTGSIYNAWANYDEIPETSLEIIGLGAQVYSLQQVAPITVTNADVATLMAGFASTMGVSFENNGVTAQVASVYLAGTVLDQVEKLARAAHIQYSFDGAQGQASGTVAGQLLSIWPQGGGRGGAIPLISPATGLVGYPKARDKAMSFRTIFNAASLPRVGGYVNVQVPVSDTSTQNLPAQPTSGPNGVWYVYGLALDLAAQMPGGPWFTDVQCVRTAGPGPG